MKRTSLLLVALIGFGLSFCAGTAKKSASDNSAAEGESEKERAGLIEMTGKPIFIDDYDRLIILETEAGEMEFSVTKKAKILKDGMPIELGKVNPKLNALIKYELGNDKNIAYKIIQITPPDTTQK